jgi:hypothetical protein
VTKAVTSDSLSPKISRLTNTKCATQVKKHILSLCLRLQTSQIYFCSGR